MRYFLAYNIMRTTLDIDEPVLSELKALRKRRGKSLGRVASDLLAVALADERRRGARVLEPMSWTAKSMGARTDLADRDALYDAMDEGGE